MAELEGIDIVPEGASDIVLEPETVGWVSEAAHKVADLSLQRKVLVSLK